MSKIYKVGGIIRDQLLGLNSKDIDFTYVPENVNQTVENGFKEMESYLKQEGYEIFLSTPEMYTIRAKFPKNHKNSGMVADFVMARKEVGYIPGTRRPILEIGSLYDDLERRDFTVNAIAEDENGVLIDPFAGQRDLKLKILRTPQSIQKSFDDDPLRILRAIRFAITKDLEIGLEMWDKISSYHYDEKMYTVSIERIREELYKCFAYDTKQTLWFLNQFPSLSFYIFKNNVLWLKPTLGNS